MKFPSACDPADVSADRQKRGELGVQPAEPGGWAPRYSLTTGAQQGNPGWTRRAVAAAAGPNGPALCAARWTCQKREGQWGWVLPRTCKIIL